MTKMLNVSLLGCKLRRVRHRGAHDEGVVVHEDLEGVHIMLVQVVHLHNHTDTRYVVRA